jgi:hypothetical protein
MANCHNQDWTRVESWAASPALSDPQREQLGRFLNDERALQSQPGTVFNHIFYAVKLGQKIGKPYDKIELDEVKAYLATFVQPTEQNPENRAPKALQVAFAAP